MNTGAEREMVPRTRPVDDEAIGIVDDLLVAVARDVPHHHLVTGPDALAAELGVLASGAPHVDDRRLPADGLLHEAGKERRVSAQLRPLIGMMMEREQATAHRVPGGVVP